MMHLRPLFFTSNHHSKSNIDDTAHAPERHKATSYGIIGIDTFTQGFADFFSRTPTQAYTASKAAQPASEKSATP